MSWELPAGCACVALPTTSLWLTPVDRTTSCSVVSDPPLHPAQDMSITLQRQTSGQQLFSVTCLSITLQPLLLLPGQAVQYSEALGSDLPA